MREPAGTGLLQGLSDSVFNGRPHREKSTSPHLPQGPGEAKKVSTVGGKSVHIPGAFPFIYKAVNQIPV